MVEIANIKVYDLEESVIASRNAMRTDIPEYTKEEFDKSLERAFKLVAASAKDPHVKCHDNFLTGIRVSFDIKYPQYFTPELQRYHFVDIVTSASKMHRLMKMKPDKACNKYVTSEAVSVLQGFIDQYNYIAEHEDFTSCSFTLRDGTKVQANTRNECLYYARMLALSNCPLGLELFMRISTNYKSLQTIFWQRRDHRLVEDWREGFINGLIAKLPYYKEFITGGIELCGIRNDRKI